MSNEQDKPKEGHVYDGIVENDNPLPTWWTWLFLLCIVFALFYYIHYEITGGPTLKEELQIAMKDIESRKALMHSQPESEDSLLALLKDENALKQGADSFAGKCAVCHGQQLQGGIGPNLTDDYWLHGKGGILDVSHTVRTGVPAQGMPAWEGVLKKEEIMNIVAFVYSKKGSHPQGAKDPQGEKVHP